VSSLDKLNKDNMQQLVEQPSPSFIYGEAVSTLESLAVLKAWAEVNNDCDIRLIQPLFFFFFLFLL